MTITDLPEATAAAMPMLATLPASGTRAAIAVTASMARPLSAPDSRTAMINAIPRCGTPSGPDSLSGHASDGAQGALAAEGQDSPQAIAAASPIVVPPAGSKTSRDHTGADAHSGRVAAADSPPAILMTESTAASPEGLTTPPAQAIEHAQPTVVASGLADSYAWLAFAADILDDLERVRIANENRLRTLTRHDDDGFGLDQSHPDVARLAALVAMLADGEHKAELTLRRAMRDHPLGPWVKTAKGIGDKQAARLIAAIGDPYWHTGEDRPRLVSELWSYCGYGDAARQVRRRGQKANWNASAKMRAYLVAESCMKQRESPYRAVYDDARSRYADAVHAAECVRCGPKGKPAQPGTPLSDGHKHARALRAVSKEILRDLWRESRRIHEHHS